MGSDIYGESVFDLSGRSVSLSLDGSVVAIGSPGHDANPNFEAKGHVRVYKFNATRQDFDQIGKDLDGQAFGESSGRSISLSGDGYTVAIGANGNAGAGHVRVYTMKTLNSLNPDNEPCPTQGTTTTGPSQGPWEIKFSSIVADFSYNSTDELVLTYLMGQGHNFEYMLYAGSCNSPSNITDIAHQHKDTISSTTDKKMSNLTIEYSFNKSSIAESNIWNETSKSIEICQILQLTLKNDRGQQMIITEDKRDISVDFDLTYNYEIQDVALEEAAINANETSTNVAGYIKSCKCTADSFTCDGRPLLPNDQLFLCIYSISVDVGIANLESMTITQVPAVSPVTGKFEVIVDESIPNPSITSRDYIDAGDVNGMYEDDNGQVQDILGDGVRIRTFLPINAFKYGAGEKVEAKGKVVLKLVNSPSRRLEGQGTPGIVRKLADVVGADLYSNEKVVYALEVNLQQQFASEDSISSAVSVISKGIGIFIMVFALINTMW
jgi:hypothetical protein